MTTSTINVIQSSLEEYKRKILDDILREGCLRDYYDERYFHNNNYNFRILNFMTLANHAELLDEAERLNHLSSQAMSILSNLNNRELAMLILALDDRNNGYLLEKAAQKVMIEIFMDLSKDAFDKKFHDWIGMKENQ